MGKPISLLMTSASTCGILASQTKASVSSEPFIQFSFNFSLDIVDIKPVNMEELTEVITAAEFHPMHCNLFMYSSSKGTIKLADMREAALCDKYAKSGFDLFLLLVLFTVVYTSVRRGRGPFQQIILLRDYLVDLGCQVQSGWEIYSIERLSILEGMGHQDGVAANTDDSNTRPPSRQALRPIRE
jgi:hypothetical protein